MWVQKMRDESKKGLIVFQDRKIRRLRHDKEWWFSVVDVVGALTDSIDSKDYWYRLKQREQESSGIELSTFCRQLKLPASDGSIKKLKGLKRENLRDHMNDLELIFTMLGEASTTKI